MAGSLLLWTHLVAYSSAPSKAQDEKTCTLSVAPADSKKLSNHAMTFHIYPKSIGASFTGCRRTWFDDGDLFLSVRYLYGAVVEVELNEPDDPQIVCGYQGSQVKRGPQARCAEIYSAVQRQKRAAARSEIDGLK